MRSALAAILLATLAPAPADATPPTRDWPAYGNSRYDFAVCYPPVFMAQGEAADRDGQRFRTRDGAELAVYGVELDGDVEDGLADDLSTLAGSDVHVRYRARKANWLVVSGTGSRGEFYLKRVRRAGQLLSWELVYPARLHALFAGLTPRMVSCFTHGSEPGE